MSTTDIQATIELLESRRLLAAPAGAVAVGDLLFFTATDADHGTELWKSDRDGSNKVLVKDIWPGEFSSTPKWLTSFNDLLYFSADHLDNGGRELYRSDGTADGTFRVVDLYPYAASSNPRNLIVINDNLIYIAEDPTAYARLWANHGTRLFPTDPRSTSSPRELTKVGALAYFLSGQRWWRTDGTVAGTQASPAIGVIVDDILRISGTDGNDQIRIDATGSTTTLAANGRTQTFDNDDFDAIEIHALDGNDTVSLTDDVTAPASIFGDLGNDSIRGGAGKDLLDDDHGYDTLDAAGGDDTLIAGPGDDTLNGGAGNDTADYTARGEPLRVDPVRIGTRQEIDAYTSIENIIGASTVDHVGYVAPVAYNDFPDSGPMIHVSGNSADNTILIRPAADYPARVEVIADGVSQFVFMFGSTVGIFIDGHEGNDTITIDPAVDLPASINGGAGNDRLVGGARNDRLDGGAGNDTLLGNDGNDALIADLGNDSADGGAGDDTIVRPVQLASVQTQTSISRGILKVVGTAQADTILLRRSASDSRDLEVVFNGVVSSHRFSEIQVVQIDARSGNDRIEFSRSGTPINLRSKIAAGAGDDVIYGSAGSDQIRGGDGNDWISAGAGNDALYGDAGNDRLFAGEGNDYLDCGTGTDLVRGDGGRDRIIATVGLDDYRKNKGDLFALTR